MANSKEGLLSGFKGRIGDLIIYKMYGKTVIRSVPEKKRKPATGSLKKKQQSFAVVMKYMQAVKAIIRIGFYDIAIDRSPYHTAMSYNLKSYYNAVNTENTDWLQLSHGNRAMAEDLYLEKESNEQAILRWGKPEAGKVFSDNDILMFITLNRRTLTTEHDLWAAKRNKGICRIKMPKSEAGDEIDFYIAFRADIGRSAKKDPDNVSDSKWIGSLLL